MSESTENDLSDQLRRDELPPDEPYRQEGPRKCKWCGSPDIGYDERVDETLVYCRDCGASL